MSAPSNIKPESGIAEAFRLPRAPQLCVRTLDTAILSTTEIRNERSGFGVTDPMPYADAAMLAVQFKAIPFHEAISDGKPVPVYGVRSGDTLFYDMRRDPRANVLTPSHSLHFVLPRRLLDEIAAATQSSVIDGLTPRTGATVRDLQLVRLARAILPALADSKRRNVLFASHFALTLGLYACRRYGGMRSPPPLQGQLDRQQRKIAAEFISANLGGGVELGELARMCGMPVRRFAVAFRETFGVNPYQWLTLRRLDLAKSLLRVRRQEIQDTAALCGFADGDHFTEVFANATGLTPFEWRDRFQ